MITIAEAPSHRIDRRVYGQFAEHLGRCIYEGLWVGADSEHPEQERHPHATSSRRSARSRCPSCAGRADASPTSTTG